VGAGGEMTQALDARMNNKTIRKKKKKKNVSHRISHMWEYTW
jgi:hypothetical protein